MKRLVTGLVIAVVLGGAAVGGITISQASDKDKLTTPSIQKDLINSNSAIDISDDKYDDDKDDNDDRDDKYDDDKDDNDDRDDKYDDDKDDNDDRDDKYDDDKDDDND